MGLAFLDYLGEVRPFFYAVAADIAHGLAEPVNLRQVHDGLHQVCEVVAAREVGAALYLLETVAYQNFANFVIRIIVNLAVVFLEVGDVHAKADCVHYANWLA